MPHIDPSDPSTPTLRLGLLLAALVMVMAAASSALAAEGGWTLAIGTGTAAPQTAVEIPVVLSTNGARVSAIAFSVDFDSSKLILDADPTLGSKVEIPAPTKFTSSSWVGTEAGAIGVAVYDRTRPIGVLPDGTIARIRFRVLQGATGFAPVRVSLTKPYSAAGQSGEPLDGEIVPGGGITIAASTGSTAAPEERSDRSRTAARPVDPVARFATVVPLAAPGSLILHNRSDETAVAQLMLLRDGFAPAGPVDVSIPAQATRSWGDPASELFGLPAATGAIVVETSNDEVLGATVPAAAGSRQLAAAIAGDRDLRAIAVSDSGERTIAVTVANLQKTEASFIVEMRDGDGALLDTRRIDAETESIASEVRLSGAGAQNLTVLIRPASAGSRFAAWVTTRREGEAPAIQTAR